MRRSETRASGSYKRLSGKFPYHSILPPLSCVVANHTSKSTTHSPPKYIRFVILYTIPCVVYLANGMFVMSCFTQQRLSCGAEEKWPRLERLCCQFGGGYSNPRCGHIPSDHVGTCLTLSVSVPTPLTCVILQGCAQALGKLSEECIAILRGELLVSTPVSMSHPLTYFLPCS